MEKPGIIYRRTRKICLHTISNVERLDLRRKEAWRGIKKCARRKNFEPL